MTTRGRNKDKTPLTEDELEIVRASLTQQEARLKEEVAAFQRTREEYERERAENKRSEYDLEAGMIALREDVRQELNRLRIDTTNYQSHEHGHPPGKEPQNLDSSPRLFESPGTLRGAPENPKIPFREVTESIPSFDGYNIPLAQFARACRRAKDIVPSHSEYHLTKLVVNRLRGRAYYAVEDEPCDTITQLIDLLNGAFGSPKTIDQYRGELSACYLKAGEHMLDYISRIKDLRTAILDAERRERGTLSLAEIDNIDGLTARSFCDGLPLQYRLQMHQEHYCRPFEAFSVAKILAKREELDRQRNAGNAPPPRTNTPRTPVYERQADRYRSPPQWRDRDTPPPRAITDGTRVPPPRETQAPARYSPPAARAVGSNMWCRYCKIPGHEIQECRKRLYNNGNNNSTPRPGNYQGPPTRQDPPRVGQRLTQAIRSIETMPEGRSESEPSEEERSDTLQQ